MTGYLTTRNTDSASVARLLARKTPVIPNRDWNPVSQVKRPRLAARAWQVHEALKGEATASVMSSEMMASRYSVLINARHRLQGFPELCGGWTLINDTGNILRRWQSVLARTNEVRRVGYVPIDGQQFIGVYEFDSLSAWDGQLLDADGKPFPNAADSKVIDLDRFKGLR